MSKYRLPRKKKKALKKMIQRENERREMELHHQRFMEQFGKSLFKTSNIYADVFGTPIGDQSNLERVNNNPYFM